MSIVAIAPEAVPGKLGGQTAKYAGFSEFQTMAGLIRDGIAVGKAYEIQLTNVEGELVTDKRALEGYKRAARKLLSQKTYAYDICVRATSIFVVGTAEPPLKNAVAKKRAPKKAK